MKRIIATVVLALLTAGGVYASGILETDMNNRPINGFAPNGLMSSTLTVASTTFDLSGNIAWGIYVPNDCKGRLMPTSAKGSYPQFTIPGGSWFIRPVNRVTPFLNISGATSGELQRQ